MTSGEPATAETNPSGAEAETPAAVRDAPAGAATAPAAGPSRLLLATAVLAACIGLVGGALAAWPIYHALGPAQYVAPAPPAPGGGGQSSPPATSGSLVSGELGAIVKVATRPAGDPSLLAGSGVATGFVVSADGLVVTSAHAVRGATALRVITQDGHTYPATVAATDAPHGLVVLRAAGASGLQTLSFAGSAPHPGDYALAVASPPFTSVSVAAGSVSSTGRTLVTDGGVTVYDVLTIDAVASTSDDGAPVFDSGGQVIGVEVTAPAAGAGVFALSGGDAAALVQQAAGGGGAAARGTFGVEAVVLDPATAAAMGVDPGALVRSVVAGGPADTGGIQPGDVILSIGGTAVDAARGVEPASYDLDPGQQVVLVVERGGQRVSLTVTVGAA